MVWRPVVAARRTGMQWMTLDRLQVPAVSGFMPPYRLRRSPLEGAPGVDGAQSFRLRCV